MPGSTKVNEGIRGGISPSSCLFLRKNVSLSSLSVFSSSIVTSSLSVHMVCTLHHLFGYLKSLLNLRVDSSELGSHLA